MRLALCAALIAALVATAGPAAATPAVTVTKCDSVTVNGNHYPRFTLEIHNPSSYYVVTNIQLRYPPYSGDPADTCSFVLSGSPPGWQSGGSFWVESEFGTYMSPGETIGGFELVLTRGDCCFTAVLDNDLLLDPVAVEPACLHCEGATPARESSWGRVKGMYR